MAKPRRGAWPRLYAAPFVVFITSIECAYDEECLDGEYCCQGGPCSLALAGDAMASVKFRPGTLKREFIVNRGLSASIKERVK